MYDSIREASRSCLLRLFALTLITVAQIGGMACAAGPGEWISETQPDGPDADLCKALLDRLNSLGDCAADAIESYPEFSNPPWKPLNPKEHIDLIARLRMAQGIGPAAAMELSGAKLEDAREGARRFVEQGGVLQLWETRLLSNFGDTHEWPAPQEPQTVVQMITKVGAAPRLPPCPGTSTKNWVTRTFLVTSDLSGLDLRLGRGKASVLMSHRPVLYKGRVLFISQTDVFRDVPGLGLTGGLCGFERPTDSEQGK